MRILILGGGSVGSKLAKSLSEPFVLVEADPSRVWELRSLLSSRNGNSIIIHGDGSSRDVIEEAGKDGEFDAAVVLMNRDFENLEAVSICRDLEIPRIIARVNRDHNMYKFIGLGAEVFKHPIGYEEGLIKTMLFPDLNHAIQIFVREGSPASGKTIMELGLPQGAVVGSILREETMIPPTPKTRIRKGDLIALDTVGKKAKQVWKIFSKKGEVESSGHIIFPLVSDESLIALKEVELLSKRLESEINFVSYPGKEDLVTAASGLISKRIHYEVVPAMKQDDTHVRKPMKRTLGIQDLDKENSELQRILMHHMEEGSPHLDILALPGPRESFLYVPFLSTNLDRMISASPMPVLIARSNRYYRSILIYLHVNCTLEIATAIQLSRVMGSKIVALTRPRYKKKTRYLKRYAQVYDVNVEVKKVIGNPTVELVKEIRNNHYDLVILNKELKELQISQMRRLVHLWSGSVLLV
ncbi:MAG: potassium channel family protein [Thermoplasmatota archaeon]